MNTAIVMLGSNYNKEDNIEIAKAKLNEYFEILRESSLMHTEPIGQKYKTKFLNQAVQLFSDESARDTIRHFKNIENDLGRSAQTNIAGVVPIDIDLIFWNGKQKRSDYDKYDFVKQCVDEIIDRSKFKIQD
ncbi:MAG: hypothetical protein AUK44_00595 [Porphyromonadaceae bacterium CG2_30_38_12]|nr:MAG: hypothetical protein AUK44_00595 [Porphyromonadaceae bacterium CG2_30_38_12]